MELYHSRRFNRLKKSFRIIRTTFIFIESSRRHRERSEKLQRIGVDEEWIGTATKLHIYKMQILIAVIGTRN